MERLSGAPEGQPGVISVRKSARLCGAVQGRSIAPEQRCRNAPGWGGGQQDGARLLPGLSCVCKEGKSCHRFILGRTRLLHHPSEPGLGCCGAGGTLQGGRALGGVALTTQGPTGPGVSPAKVLSSSRG